jgi:hypothetical protein
MEDPMLHFAALLAFVTPAGAHSGANSINLNGLSNGISNGTSLNGIPMNGSALGDLNGVAVEAVIIPEAAIR